MCVNATNINGTENQEEYQNTLIRKNRNLQCYVWYRVLKNKPESSKVPRIISGVEARIKPKKRIRQRKYKAFLKTDKGKVYIRKYRNISHSHDFKKVVIWFKLFSHNNEYRHANNKGKYSKYKLSNDIEKNSQGNVHIFGVNAGQQCVAMSLCALIYHNMRGINSSNDLLKTMHIGNELYSSLSQLARQSFLMLTELPTLLTVLDENDQLDYLAASYTGTIHADSTIDGFQYCMGLQRALQSLISQQYNSFTLIVGVANIYYPDAGQFRIFDSHARVFTATQSSTRDLCTTECTMY